MCKRTIAWLLTLCMVFSLCGMAPISTAVEPESVAGEQQVQESEQEALTGEESDTSEKIIPESTDLALSVEAPLTLLGENNNSDSVYLGYVAHTDDSHIRYSGLSYNDRKAYDDANAYDKYVFFDAGKSPQVTYTLNGMYDTFSGRLFAATSAYYKVKLWIEFYLDGIKVKEYRNISRYSCPCTLDIEIDVRGASSLTIKTGDDAGMFSSYLTIGDPYLSIGEAEYLGNVPHTNNESIHYSDFSYVKEEDRTDNFGNVYNSCVIFDTSLNPQTTYTLDKSYSTFHGRVFAPQDSGDDLSLWIEIYLDGIKVNEFRNISKSTEPIDFDIDVSGADTMTFKTGNTAADSHGGLVIAIPYISLEKEFAENAPSLSVSENGLTSISLFFDLKETDTAARYYIYRNGDMIADVDGNTYTDTGLLDGTEYIYTVKAYKSNGEWSKERTIQVATEKIIVSGECGTASSWTLNRKTGELVIAGTGDVPENGSHWKYYSSEIKSVIIGEGILSIGNRAFEGCSSLETISLPDSLKQIGECLFYGCSSLKEITIPDDITDILNKTFWDCSNLKTVHLPDGLKSIGTRAFNNCNSLVSISLPEGISTIGSYAFYNCSSLLKFTIPSSVTSVGNSFIDGCRSLVDLVVLVEDPTVFESPATGIPYYCGLGSIQRVSVPVGTEGAYRGVFNFLTDFIVTPEVSNLRVTQATSNSIDLAWAKPDNPSIVGYYIYRDEAKIGETVTNSFSDKTVLLPDTTYKYEVCGYSHGGTNLTNKVSLDASTISPSVQSVYSNSDTVNLSDNKIIAKVKSVNNCTQGGSGVFQVDRNGEWISIGSGIAGSIVSENNTPYRLYYMNWVGFGDLTNGNHKIRFVFTDRDGPSANAEGTVTLYSGTPSSVSDLQADFYPASNTVHLSWPVNEETDAVKYDVYQRMPNSFRFDKITTVFVDENQNLSYDVTCDKEGTYAFYVVGINQYGTKGKNSNEASVMVIHGGTDSTPPVIESVSPSDNSIVGNPCQISASVKDNIGVKTVIFSVSEDGGNTWEEKQSSGQNAFALTTSSMKAPFQVKVVAMDEAGNTSDPYIVTYTADTTASAPPTNLTITTSESSATIKWKAPDDEDLAGYLMSIDGGEATKLGTVTEITISDLAPNKEVSVVLTPVDRVGNKGTPASITGTTLKDTTAPTYYLGGGGATSQYATFYYGVDDLGGVSLVEWFWSNDRETWHEFGEKAFSGTTYAYGYFNVDVRTIQSGDLFVALRVTDQSGNVSETPCSTTINIVKVVVDYTAPDAPTKLKASTKDGKVTLTWAPGALEEEDQKYNVYQCDTEKGIYTKVMSNVAETSCVVRNLTPGREYYFKVSAVDPVGNESAYSTSVKVNTQVDTVNPEIVSVYSSDENRVSEQANAIAVLAQDNYKLDSVTVYYSVNGSEPAYLDSAAQINEYYLRKTFTLPVEQFSEEDTIHISILAQDINGNLSEEWTRDYVVDKSVAAAGTPTVVFDNTNNAVKLTWNCTNDEADLVGYQIYRQDSGAQIPVGSVYRHSGNNVYAFTDETISDEAITYTYTIEAVDTTGNKNSVSTSSISLLDRGGPTAVIRCDSSMMTDTAYTLSGVDCTDIYNITSYQWSIDGVSRTGKEVSYKFTETGEKTITLTVKDEKGHTARVTKTVSIRPKEDVGVLRVTVKDDSGNLLPGADVYFDFKEENQVIRTTNINGCVEFTAEPKSYTIAALKGNNEYLPAEVLVSVDAGKTKDVTIILKKQPILQAKVESRRLSYDEIVEAGIDVTNPENQNTVAVDITVAFGADIVNFTQLTGMNGNKKTAGQKTSIQRGEDAPLTLQSWSYDQAVVIMAIPTGVKTLKDFFNVSLMVVNTAYKGFDLVNNYFSLQLPDGLSLANSTTGEHSTDIQVDTIAGGGGTYSADWIVRGDKPGEYSLSVDYSGILSGFNTQITDTFEAEEKTKVVGMEGLTLEVQIPEELSHGTLYYNTLLKNDGEYDINFPPVSEKLQPTAATHIKKDGTTVAVNTYPKTLCPGESVLTRFVCKDGLKILDDSTVNPTNVAQSITTATTALLADWYQLQGDESYGLKIETVTKPLTYFTEQAMEDSGLNVDTNSKLTIYKGVENVVVVPEGIVMIGKDAFKDNSTMNTVKVSWTVDTIENDAFVNCSNLTSVVLSKGVMNINESAFAGKEDLKFKVYAGSAAEQYCKNKGFEYEAIREELVELSEDMKDNRAAIDLTNNSSVMNFSDTNVEQATGETGAHLKLLLQSVGTNFYGRDEKYTFDVQPVDSEGNDIPNDKIDREITFRLPVSSNVAASSVTVYHESEYIGDYPVLTEGGSKYIEIKGSAFSEYSYELPHDSFNQNVEVSEKLVINNLPQLSEEEVREKIRETISENTAVSSFVDSNIKSKTTTGNENNLKAVIKLLQDNTNNETTKTAIGKLTGDNTLTSYVNVVTKDVSFDSYQIGTKSENVITTMTFEVKPVAQVYLNGETVKAEIPNAQITGPITFRLPIDERVPVNTKVEVRHRDSSDKNFDNFGTYLVKEDDDGQKYIQLSSSEFSEFKCELTKDIVGAEYAFSLTLVDSINVNFYMENLTDNPSDYEVEYTFKGVTKKIKPDNKKENKFVVAECAAKEMGENIHVKITYGENKDVIREGDYSVKQYCINKISKEVDPNDKKYEESQALKALCRAVLDYGANAQIYFDYKTDALVNDGNEGTPLAIPGDMNVKKKEGLASTVASIATYLTLESKTLVTFVLEPASGTSANEIEISSVTVGGEPAEYETKLIDGNLEVTVHGIAAKELNKEVVVTVQNSLVLTYSPLSYAYTKQNSTTHGLAELVKSLYEYYLCAVKYFNIKQ